MTWNVPCQSSQDLGFTRRHSIMTGGERGSERADSTYPDSIVGSITTVDCRVAQHQATHSGASIGTCSVWAIATEVKHRTTSWNVLPLHVVFGPIFLGRTDRNPPSSAVPWPEAGEYFANVPVVVSVTLARMCSLFRVEGSAHFGAIIRVGHVVKVFSCSRRGPNNARYQS